MSRVSVTLRKKAISGGKYSLYLDFYPAIFNPKTGEYSRREFLKLYIFAKPKNAIEKISNSECLKTAELICIRRQNEACKEYIYTPFELEQLKIKAIGEKSFTKSFKKQADRKNGSNQDIWNCAIYHFEQYSKGKNALFK